MDEWCITQSNREKIERFLKLTQIEGIGMVRRSKYLWALKRLLKAVPKDFDSFTREDLEDFFFSIKELKPQTQRTYWFSTSKFYKVMKLGEMPKELRPRCPSKSSKLPEELLTEEEVQKMIQHEPQLRNKAFIALLYESGMRIGEMLTRKLKHVVFDDLGAVIMADGKTGMRRIRLIQSVPLLASYISNLPHNDTNTFLWISLNNYETPIEHRAAKMLLHTAAKRAGIKKHVYPHLFRHTRATHMAKHLTEQQLKVYFGWAGDSRMASIYVHLSGKDIDNAVLGLYGLKPKVSQDDNPKPKMCLRCSTNNSPSAKLCGKCGMVLDIREAIGVTDNESHKFEDFMKEMYEKWRGR
ncbi:MAG: tyrosine-type recombinase/integrase [Candidatus Aenigmarchaeota archaeon]|nr:tyrosine-type recombinase/integrase [Candidatus Aenigmarchaeota archaeon]